MPIKGFQGTSLLDFPGRIASLIFFGGCNLSCPYCHNPSLVFDPDQHPDIDPADLLAELRGRRSFIDGVVVTGGEPTVDPGLLPFLREVKTLGLQVKLDTNGLAPAVLERALGENLLDFVALDLKTAPYRYGELHRGPVDLELLGRSVRLLIDSGIEYELRTTCVPGLVERADIRALGEIARGAGKWMLQQYHPAHALAGDWRGIEPYPAETLSDFAAMAEGYVDEVGVRGI